MTALLYVAFHGFLLGICFVCALYLGDKPLWLSVCIFGILANATAIAIAVFPAVLS